MGYFEGLRKRNGKEREGITTSSAPQLGDHEGRGRRGREVGEYGMKEGREAERIDCLEGIGVVVVSFSPAVVELDG